ncbi:hypothetical protein WN944_006220 [Citrus x changshan-huyou]|uniref:Uncharacterized protein n=1 Tax=Citrus x changshan-huyou TaxID=2935761 RepID=A0AAP0QX02_9ROSI
MALSEYQLPPSLTHLSLSNIELLEDPMLTLDKLPHLQVLKLKQNSYSGRKLACVCSGGFPELKSYEAYKSFCKLDLHWPQPELRQLRQYLRAFEDMEQRNLSLSSPSSRISSKPSEYGVDIHHHATATKSETEGIATCKELFDALLRLQSKIIDIGNRPQQLPPSFGDFDFRSAAWDRFIQTGNSSSSEFNHDISELKRGTEELLGQKLQIPAKLKQKSNLADGTTLVNISTGF